MVPKPVIARSLASARAPVNRTAGAALSANTHIEQTSQSSRSRSSSDAPRANAHRRAFSSSTPVAQPHRRRTLHQPSQPLPPSVGSARPVTAAAAQRTVASSDAFPVLLTGSWSTSPVNTGNPIFFSDPAFTTGPVEPDTHVQPALPDEWQPLPWSTSLCNTGNPFDEGLFAPLPSSPRATAVEETASLLSRLGIVAAPHSPAMASDADYNAFLEGASADQQSSAQSKSQSQSKSENSSNLVTTQSVHPALRSVDATYTSDTDAPFTPISLALTDSPSNTLTRDTVASLARVNASAVEELELKQFDPKNKYADVVASVKKACGSAPSVFRVDRSGARCEYWIVGLAKNDGAVVGVSAEAVES